MFKSSRISLADIIASPEYEAAVTRGAAAFGRMSKAEADELMYGKVELYPESFQRKNDELLSMLGTSFGEPVPDGMAGAPTDSFAHSLSIASAPVTGFGCFRLGEDGGLYLLGKSEHYHASLGHCFPGYALIERAHKLGILNPTHNNTRGFLTRRLERELVAAVNDASSDAALDAVLACREHKVLNRVINLETGSLAVEAGIKMMLNRFYALDGSQQPPKYAGKTPVFFVMQDYGGGLGANYHGTTVLAQTFRGMWPELYAKMGGYKVVSVKINDIADFEAKIAEYNRGQYKTAGFLHELVLMNYGAIRLNESYINAAYALCERTDTPTLVDEIQSCMWYKGMFLYKKYGIKPDFVIIGKGFSGGEYPASKIITTGEMDTLNLFGALVTNGQEELASLAYLITMRFSADNGDEIERVSELFFDGLREAAARHRGKIESIEGQGHLVGIRFASVERAAAFAKGLRERRIDASAQLYKADCPPAVLLKPPVTMSEQIAGCLVSVVDELAGAE